MKSAILYNTHLGSKSTVTDLYKLDCTKHVWKASLEIELILFFLLDCLRYNKAQLILIDEDEVVRKFLESFPVGLAMELSTLLAFLRLPF